MPGLAGAVDERTRVAAPRRTAPPAGATVFVNPYQEMEDAEAAEEQAAKKSAELKEAIRTHTGEGQVGARAPGAWARPSCAMRRAQRLFTLRQEVAALTQRLILRAARAQVGKWYTAPGGKDVPGGAAPGAAGSGGGGGGGGVGKYLNLAALSAQQGQPQQQAGSGRGAEGAEAAAGGRAGGDKEGDGAAAALMPPPAKKAKVAAKASSALTNFDAW